MRYNRTQASRAIYAWSTYFIVVGYPLWLKIMTVGKIKNHHAHRAWKRYGDIEFSEGSLGTKESCTVCNQYYSGSVKWPVSVKLSNVSGLAQGGQYVVLFTSSEWKKGSWYQSSVPSILNSIHSFNQTYDVCMVPNQLTFAPSLSPTHMPTLNSKKSETVLSYEDVEGSVTETSSLPVTSTTANRRLGNSIKLTGDDAAISQEDKDLLECCMGSPGPVYMVACVVDSFSAFSGDSITKLNKNLHPPFDDLCTAATGICGASCGTQVKDPDHCVDGKIPDDLLIAGSSGCSGNDCSSDDFAKANEVPVGDIFDFGENHRYYFTQTPEVWHWFFMVMMFMSYVSISLASMPGAGLCGSANERLPILHTLDQNGAIKDGVKCINFSISASEHKIWVLRNILGKVASSFLHPSARLYDYFQDEGSRAGAFAVWDALVNFMHVSQPHKEDTIGMCKYWASRLRDPGETLSSGLDTFKKDSENKAVSMSSIERELDAFEDIHAIAVKFGVNDERVSMLHYAYELYELIECLGDRAVWTGWDVKVGSKEEAALKVSFDDHPSGPKGDTKDRRGSTDLDQERPTVVEANKKATTGASIRAQAFADKAALLEFQSNEGDVVVRHLDGFRDWLHHPVMGSFVLQWAHSLIDTAYAQKKSPNRLDPFSDDVLAFARKDSVALKCAQSLHIFAAATKLGDKENGKGGGGRFLDAYQNFKKTTGQLLYDFIDEREITFGASRGAFSWVPATLIYSTRAKPERRDKDAIKKRNLQPGIYACLNGDIDLPSYPPGLTKWEGHRRCYGKVREILSDRNVDGRRVKFVELSTLSEDMINNKPYLESLYSEASEVQALWTPTIPGSKASSELAGAAMKLTSNAFIQLPLSILAPLLRCRGKAGGMNFAVKILEEREYEKAARDPTHHIPSLTLFAIFDCRHMVTPGFWEQTILHFFREKDGEVQLQPTVKYCQVPQNFIGVELSTDYLDMQNEYLFRYVNCMRDGVGAVTSCGTNCVWAIERGFEYEEKTMIEDTATSHKVILQGYEGTYHYEKLIFGTPKDNKDFLAAIFRWSRGAVQLFWLAVFGGRSEGSAGVPFFWMVLTLVVLPMAVVVFGMQACRGNGRDSVIAAAAIYAFYFTAATTSWCIVMSREFGHLLRYIVLFDNSTYFFNTWPAYFWCLVLPGYMCNAGDIPFKYTLMVVGAGGITWEILQWVLIIEVKGWSIVEAFYSGTMSAYRIITRHHDASSWSSFGAAGPGDWIVNWLTFLVTFECTSILSAITQLGFGGLKDSGKVTSFGVGITTALIFLALVFDPFCILVTGKTRTVTLKHAYFFFWCVMLGLGIIAFGIMGDDSSSILKN